MELELSAGEIQSIHMRVFHTPVSRQDSLMAIRKVTGDKKGTSCHAGKILDILLEIENERALKEAMVNAGILTGKLPDSSGVLPNPSLHEQPQELSQNKGHFQGGYFQDQKAQSSVYRYRLRKDVKRICSSPVLWFHSLREENEARIRDCRRREVKNLSQLNPAPRLPSLSSLNLGFLHWFSREGLRHALLSIYYGVKSIRPNEPYDLWSPCADLLQQIDNKYDIIQQKLCTEMLQNHYGKLSWEALSPWLQRERVEELADWAEWALDNTDLLCLSELPGAFQLYRGWDRVVLRSCPEQVNPDVRQWTAALSLKELHSCRQEEKRGLAPVMESLTVKSLWQLSLYVQVTMMRVEREKHSHGALLAGRQSWESWPDVRRPHFRDLARFWLGEQNPWNSDSGTFCDCSLQAVLQCMLSCQECEREHLIELFHNLTPEELQGPVLPSSQGIENLPESRSALRQLCIIRLREIKSDLGEAVSWGDCALKVLTELMKLQDAEEMALIQNMHEVRKDELIELHSKYTAELQAKTLANLFLLLLPDSCPHSKPMGNSVNVGSSSLELLHQGEISEIPQETSDNVKGGQEMPAVSSERGELSSAECRNSLVREEIPYLEVLHDKTIQEEPYGERAIVKGEDGPCNGPLYFEKQGSLIAVAWGKPAEDANNQVLSDELLECEAAPSLRQEEVNDTPHLQMASEDAGEDEAPALFQCSPCDAGHQDEAYQEDVSASKIPLYEATVDGELHEERMDPQMPSVNQSEPVFSEFSLLAGDIQDQRTEEAIYSGKSSPNGPTIHGTRPEDETGEDKKGQIMEEASKEPHFNIPTASLFEKCEGKAERFQEHSTEQAASTIKIGKVTKDYRKEATIMHISEMEREETMKSLVDIQRKAENKCQREKERQMFRIQERLSIIQNKKSEEDLLGRKQGDSLKELTENFKQEDRHRQKTLVKEKLEQLRRERSHVMQSKRDRNANVFKELLDPVVLQRPEQEEIVNSNS